MILVLILLGSTNVAADEESYTSYDDIVAELRATAEQPTKPESDLEWEAVALHAGMGLTAETLSFETPDGISGSGILKGIEAHVGMNIFSRKARAEFLFRTYAKEPIASGVSADLKEFELRVVFLPMVNDKMNFRLGGGFAARDLQLSARSGEFRNEYASSTPASTFFLGVERKVTHNLTFGPDVSYRSSMVSDSIDRRAFNATLRMNATF